MQLNAKSETLLKKVHPDLVRVVRRAALSLTGDLGFVVTCGLRTLEEQKRLKAAGASRTLRSRHLPGAKTGLAHAVDLAAVLGGAVKWDWPLYAKLGAVLKAAAKVEKVPLEWGGDWKTFKDGPHFQLPWDKYPG
jgi:peptidoglycan L-alanyl-D-glutamate endopeptidase CwlK